MLSLLRIRNFAIIDELEVVFGPGLNIMTGETGAGKSIILSAIEYVTGKRAPSDIIRAGEDRCTIEAVFELSEEELQNLQATSPAAAENCTERELLVKRVIETSGRGRVFLNNELSTVAELQATIGQLVDITSQHEQHRLCVPEQQRMLLDSFGVPEALTRAVFDCYQTYAAARAKLESFRSESATRRSYFDALRFELQELSQAGLQVGEREQIENRLRVLANTETIAILLSEANQLIDEDDTSIDILLRKLCAALQNAAMRDQSLEEARQCAENAHIQISEAKHLIEEYAASLQVDDKELEQMRARVAELAHLERKYRKTDAELVDYLAKITTELEAFDSGALSEEALERALVIAEKALITAEDLLTAKRITVASELTQAVEAGLASVNMRRARFKVALEPTEHTPHGKERVSFLLAANPGEELKPLGKVASGGELSRVLLILKTVLGEKAGATTQIFDEIDTGVSGPVAQAVGEKLREAAKRAQVIIVTHAPQIASLASTHLRLEKQVTGERTTVAARALGKAERIDELASMLGGKKASKEFVASAKQLLKQAAEQ